MNNTVISIAIQSGVPVLLWGNPGTGKTAAVNSISRALGMHCETIIASIREPADFSGLPYICEGATKLAPPAWAVRLARAGRAVLFLDEINTAPPAVQAALLRVVLDRVVGEFELPASVSVVAAANPVELATGGWDLGPSLANRVCHLTWAPDPREWVEGMLKGWPAPIIPRLPDDWENRIPAARATVASFISHRLVLVEQVPRSEEQAGRAWASRRTWDMAARLLAACESVGADEDTRASLIAGCVGSGPAMEFLAWLRDLDLPDPEQLLSNPTGFTLPARGDQAFAILSSVAVAATSRLDKSRWLAAWKILAIAAQQGGKDIAAVAAKTLAVARRPDLPLPAEELKPFIPLLKAGGML